MISVGMLNNMELLNYFMIHQEIWQAVILWPECATVTLCEFNLWKSTPKFKFKFYNSQISKKHLCVCLCVCVHKRVGSVVKCNLLKVIPVLSGSAKGRKKFRHHHHICGAHKPFSNTCNFHKYGIAYLAQAGHRG
jgi:hypothetical protein